MQDGKESISDQELADRGIKVEQKPYVEYVKRPPHDKYLWTRIDSPAALNIAGQKTNTAF